MISTRPQRVCPGSVLTINEMAYNRMIDNVSSPAPIAGAPSADALHEVTGVIDAAASVDLPLDPGPETVTVASTRGVSEVISTTRGAADPYQRGWKSESQIWASRGPADAYRVPPHPANAGFDQMRRRPAGRHPGSKHRIRVGHLQSRARGRRAPRQGCNARHRGSRRSTTSSTRGSPSDLSDGEEPPSRRGLPNQAQLGGTPLGASHPASINEEVWR